MPSPYYSPRSCDSAHSSDESNMEKPSVDIILIEIACFQIRLIRCGVLAEPREGIRGNVFAVAIVVWSFVSSDYFDCIYFKMGYCTLLLLATAFCFQNATAATWYFLRWNTPSSSAQFQSVSQLLSHPLTKSLKQLVLHENDSPQASQSRDILPLARPPRYSQHRRVPIRSRRPLRNLVDRKRMVLQVLPLPLSSPINHQLPLFTQTNISTATPTSPGVTAST